MYSYSVDKLEINHYYYYYYYYYYYEILQISDPCKFLQICKLNAPRVSINKGGGN